MPYTANPVWSLAVNWDGGVLERLEWKTDVMGSELGQEQRVSRRLYPRRSFEASFLLNKEDRQYFDVLASSTMHKQTVIPIWHDVVPLTATANAGQKNLTIDTRFREFVAGGLVFIRGPNARTFEIGTAQVVGPSNLQLISNLENTWLPGTFVYPAKLGKVRSEQLRPTKHTDQLSSMQAEFQLITPSKVAASWAPNYKFLPVIRTRPNDADEQTFEYSRVMSILDNDIGDADMFDVREGPVFHQSHSWTLHGASEAQDFRKLLYSLKGRTKALWLPTYMSDMTLAAPITTGDSYIDIVNIGIAANEAVFDGRKDIRIELANGNVYYREIDEVVALSSTVERVALDAAIGADAAIDEVISISYMMVARLAQDSVELNHITDSAGITTCSLNFFGPAQGLPLTLPLYTSKPYPVNELDAIDVDISLERALLWSMELHAMDVVPSLISVDMPTVVSYKEYEYEEAMDVEAGMVSVYMPTVVAYHEYNYEEALDVGVSMVDVVMIEYPAVPYTMDDEAIDVSVSLVGVTLS